MKSFLPLLITWFHMGFFIARNFRWSSLRDCCGSTPGSQLEAGVLTLSLITISAEISIPFIISGSICLLKLGKHCHCCVLFLIVLLMFVCLFCSFVCSFICSMHGKAKKNTLGDPWVHDEAQKGSWGKGKLLRTLPGMVAGWTHINAARNFDTHLGKDAFVALDSCYHPWFQDHCPQQKSRLGEQCCLPQN